MSKTYKKWTPTDIQFILDNQNMLDKDVAVKLTEITGQNVSASMVRRQRRKSGIVRKRGRPSKNTIIVSNT